MSSWFSGLAESLEKVKQQVNAQDITSTVQNALPKLDNNMLQNLTLTSPELVAERKRIDEQEKRKMQVRDSLAGMMPWETRDPERDILVEECRDAILELSRHKATFFGPYQMPKINVKLEEEVDLMDEVTDLQKEETKTEENQESDPSAGSLEKLAKLEPLPVLLQNFDLDSHVGLIEKVLKADRKLVQMQASHSGMYCGLPYYFCAASTSFTKCLCLPV